MTKEITAPNNVRQMDQLPEEEIQKRKKKVLTQGRASVTHSIADAVVIKNENLYFLSEPDGTVPLEGRHGFGLYYHDCRYLHGYDLNIAGKRQNVLVSTATSGSTAIFELTNPALYVKEGKKIDPDVIGVTWERELNGDQKILHDRIQFKNFSRDRIQFPVELSLKTGFEDVFSIRGLLVKQPGKVNQPKWQDGTLVFSYDGADQLNRSLVVQFSPEPESRVQTSASFEIELEPGKSRQIDVTLTVAESETHNAREVNRGGSHKNSKTNFRLAEGHTEFQSNSLLLNQIMESSLNDLRMLVMRYDNDEYYAAGIPWFTTLFGRDSLITAMQTLSVNPEIATETLKLLADFQADEKDDWRDAEPGKILHELRIGELARLHEIPHTPYYGTVDATPLFLNLLVKQAGWLGDLSLFNELRQNIDRALNWIDQFGDANGDGYVEYESLSKSGLINQGWKDSGNGIITENGDLATPPISLVEVQGYVYQAKSGLADLFERAGDKNRAEKLRKQAGTLRDKFNDDFWMEDKGIYTLALEKDGTPLRVVSSNPGHALWTGIATKDKARRTAERLMQDDMFSGWGIRTLSKNEVGYNPIGYHLGTVWPHDNAIIAAGFRRYGYDDLSQKILKGLLEAVMSFKGYRIPELISGFSRAKYDIPVHYPVACHPQAWGAGSIPYLVSSFLGLEPSAFEKKLFIHRPILPEFVDWLKVKGLHVGKSTVDLHFERRKDRSITVDVENNPDGLEILQT